MARLTTTGQNLVAAAVGGGPKLQISKFVFANIPGLVHTTPEPANEPMPNPAHIVFQRAPTKDGIVDENRVAYSQMMLTDVGPFAFNWIGIVYTHPVNGDQLVMFSYVPLTQKVKTEGAVAGNVVTRNFVIEHVGIANATPVVVSAESWMFDFVAYINEVKYDLMVLAASLGNAATKNVGTTAGTVAAGDDGRFSNAREWTASEVTQAEAEAGTATTARKWTALRVRQATAAWWEQQNKVIAANTNAVAGYAYHITNGAAVTTLEPAATAGVGGKIRITKARGLEPAVQASGAEQIITGRGTDTSVILVAETEYIFVSNGTQWEV